MLKRYRNGTKTERQPRRKREVEHQFPCVELVPVQVDLPGRESEHRKPDHSQHPLAEYLRGLVFRLLAGHRNHQTWYSHHDLEYEFSGQTHHIQVHKELNEGGPAERGQNRSPKEVQIVAVGVDLRAVE